MTTKLWKMKLAKIGETIEVKVPAQDGDVLTSVLGRIWDKIIAEGKSPTNYMPVSDPELIEE